MAAAAGLAENTRGSAFSTIIEVLRTTDPARAAALAADHAALLASRPGSGFSAYGPGFTETWTFLNGLPADKNRAALMAEFLNDGSSYHADEVRKMWDQMPEAQRRELVVDGGFLGLALRSDAERFTPGFALEGMADLWRDRAGSGDPDAVRIYLRNGATKWAETDPAAAIDWALQNLKGETRVTGTALLFQAGAAHDFAAAAAAWQNQAEGTLRVRAAAGLAAGATAEDRAAVDALLSTLSPGIR